MSEYIVMHGIHIAKDFIPETFGCLTTIGPKFLMACSRHGKRHARQMCVTLDGTPILVYRKHLTGGHVTGGKNSASRKKYHVLIQRFGIEAVNLTHASWERMIYRCYSSNSQKYKTYGGKGVTVCPEWLDVKRGFIKFIECNGIRTSKDLTIDRYPDPNGNYEPGNTRWATQKEQQRNRTNNRLLTFDGKTQCLAAWAEETGLRRNLIANRLKRGWSVQDALAMPIKTHVRKHSQG